MIQGISLGDVSARDRVVWRHTQSGSYMVKLGYYFLSKKKEQLGGDTNTPAPS